MFKQTKRILALLVTISTFLFMGCDKMDSLQKEFSSGGSKIYANKTEDLKARGGDGRIEISWLRSSNPNMRDFKIYWNNKRDSVEGSLKEFSKGDSIRILINDLEESVYSFEVYTYDDKERASIKTEVVGKSYGDRFKNAVLPVVVKNLSRDQNTNSVRVDFGEKEDKAFYGGNIYYLNTNGEETTVFVDGNVDGSIIADLPNFPLGGSFDFATLYVPEENSLDTFSFYQTTAIPTDTVSFDEYVMIRDHLGSIFARETAAIMDPDPNLNIHQLYIKEGNSFHDPIPIGIGWIFYIFDEVMPTRGMIVCREGPSGLLYKYAMDGNGNISDYGWPNSYVSDIEDFNIYNPIFTTDTYVYGRTPGGDLVKYPFLNHSTPSMTIGDPITYSSVDFNQYDKIVSNGSFLFGIDPSGKLWRIKENSDNTIGNPVQVGQRIDWSGYNILSKIDNDLMLRDVDGILWRVPINGNGELGELQLLSMVVETI